MQITVSHVFFNKRARAGNTVNNFSLTSHSFIHIHPIGSSICIRLIENQLQNMYVYTAISVQVP